jgi:hypothetical protein
MAFSLSGPPPAGFTPIFPPPEDLDNVQNIAGFTPAQFASLPPPPDVAQVNNGESEIPINGQVGNLQLTAQEETDLVNFLKTLTDGYTRPNPVTAAPGSPLLTVLPPQTTSGQFVVQLIGEIGQLYIVQTSSNLTTWLPVSTNLITGPSLTITNTPIAGATQQFWRVVPEL